METCKSYISNFDSGVFLYSYIADFCYSYAGFDPRFDIQWNQKRIEWGFSSISSAQGIGPVINVTSPDMTCRFSPTVPPALTAVARAGSDVVYKWTDYPGSHKGPIITVGSLFIC